MIPLLNEPELNVYGYMAITATAINDEDEYYPTLLIGCSISFTIP